MINKKLLHFHFFFLIFPLIVVALIAVAMPVWADAVCYEDQQGADDEPGQKDLNRLCVDDEPPPADLVDVEFQWDQTAWTGNNSGDACILFDTNDNGNADFALCETVRYDPAQHYAQRLYQCTADSWATRCMGPLDVPVQTVCTASVQQGTDPFHPGEADTHGYCPVLLADLGGAPSAELLDVCTYPSEQPNSDPSDCVLSPTAPTAIVLLNVTAENGSRLNGAFAGAIILLGVATIGVAIRLRKVNQPAERTDPRRQ